MFQKRREVKTKNNVNENNETEANQIEMDHLTSFETSTSLHVLEKVSQ